MSAAGGYSMARRNELARQRGFVNYAQQRRFSSTIKNRADLEGLPPDARETRQAALDVLARSRREGIDLRDAARREGISVDAVVWWTPGAVVRSGGVLTPRAGDRLFRSMYVYSGGQVVPLDVRGNRVSSSIGAYHAAVHHYVHHSDASRLTPFVGKRVGRVELETDLDLIDELSRRGEFNFESIYRMVGP